MEMPHVKDPKKPEFILRPHAVKMEPLIICGKKEISPEIRLDQEKGIFEFSGYSRPEDALKFYTPVFEWMAQYAEKPNAETIFNFFIEYYNSASARTILSVFLLINNIAKKSKTKVRWHYENDDLDMRSSGETFSKITTVPFEFIAH